MNSFSPALLCLMKSGKKEVDLLDDHSACEDYSFSNLGVFLGLEQQLKRDWFMTGSIYKKKSQA